MKARDSNPRLRRAVVGKFPCHTISPVLSTGDRVLITGGACVAALDAATGEEIWTKGWKSGQLSATLTRSTLVLAGRRSRVYGLNPLTGGTKWEVKIRG